MRYIASNPERLDAGKGLQITAVAAHARRSAGAILVSKPPDLLLKNPP